MQGLSALYSRSRPSPPPSHVRRCRSSSRQPTMALASFATKAVSGLGLRCGLPALASRAYATGEAGGVQIARGGRKGALGWETCSVPRLQRLSGPLDALLVFHKGTGTQHCAVGPPPTQLLDYGVAAAATAAGCGSPSPCRPLTSAVVDGLKYAKDHEWVKVEGDVATVGITDHAQVGVRGPSCRVRRHPLAAAAAIGPAVPGTGHRHALGASVQGELGDVVYAEMPEVGASFSAGDRMAIVESVKVRSRVVCAAGVWASSVSAVIVSEGLSSVCNCRLACRLQPARCCLVAQLSAAACSARACVAARQRTCSSICPPAPCRLPATSSPPCRARLWRPMRSWPATRPRWVLAHGLLAGGVALFVLAATRSVRLVAWQSFGGAAASGEPSAMRSIRLAPAHPSHSPLVLLILHPRTYSPQPTPADQH